MTEYNAKDDAFKSYEEAIKAKKERGDKHYVKPKNKQYRTFNCQRCGEETTRYGALAKFCEKCSFERSRETRTKWARNNYGKNPEKLREKSIKNTAEYKPFIIEAGKELSESGSIGFVKPIPNYEWVVRFKIPYTQALSKNHIYTMGGHHVFKRQQSKAVENAIAHATKAAIRHLSPVQNKVWIGLIVEKENNRSDAVNVVDLVCDGIKQGLGIDDRWFCIDFLDWRINKNDPFLYIQIAQESSEHVQACSHCGRLLSLENFRKKKNAKLGVDRVCKECHSLALRMKREAKA